MLSRIIAGLVLVASAWGLLPTPASAGFTVCNYAPWPLFVSLAYNDKDKGWVAMGWWEVQREACAELVAGSVQGRKLYGWAVTHSVSGASWRFGDVGEKGTETLCTPPAPKAVSHFSIYQNDVRGGCKNAGYVEHGFRVVSNGDKADNRYSFYLARPLPPADARLQKPKDRFWECGGCPEMVVMPTGDFTMGSPDNEPQRRGEEGPRHKVTIGQRLAVSKGPVTRDQFDRFVTATGYEYDNKCLIRKDGRWTAEQGRSYKEPGFAQGGNHPVVCVSFDDAKAYLVWLSKQAASPYRLLSEAEWEYVARAGSDSPFWWGATVTPGQANYNGNIVYPGGSKGEFREKTVPAFDSFKLNPWNLFIGAGNAAEWVEDCWNKNYQGAPPDGTAWTKGECGMRVVRGGSWASDPGVLRSAARFAVESSVRSSDVGFRVARTIEK
jgi:formylglycine-generating enzyme required for sulfatase activity